MPDISSGASASLPLSTSGTSPARLAMVPGGAHWCDRDTHATALRTNYASTGVALRTPRATVRQCSHHAGGRSDITHNRPATSRIRTGPPVLPARDHTVDDGNPNACAATDCGTTRSNAAAGSTGADGAGTSPTSGHASDTQSRRFSRKVSWSSGAITSSTPASTAHMRAGLSPTVRAPSHPTASTHQRRPRNSLCRCSAASRFPGAGRCRGSGLEVGPSPPGRPGNIARPSSAYTPGTFTSSCRSPITRLPDVQQRASSAPPCPTRPPSCPCVAPGCGRSS